MASAQTYLFQCAGPILILIGTVGCILNLTVFNQKNLKKNPCSIYFIAYNLANLVYIYASLFSLTLEVGYNIDPSAYNLVVCRIRLYITILSNVLSPFYLILASIDRIFITSPNAVTRRRSTRRLAYLCVVTGTLFWALFHSHILIVSNITHFGPISFCYFQQGLQLTFAGYYSIIKELLALSSMIICGLWAIRNIRSIRHVTAASNLPVSRTVVEDGAHSTSSKDRQLAIMLLMDITVLYSIQFCTCNISHVSTNYTKWYRNYWATRNGNDSYKSISILCWYSFLYKLLCKFNCLEKFSTRNEENTSLQIDFCAFVKNAEFDVDIGRTIPD